MKFKLTKKRIIWSLSIIAIILVLGYVIFGKKSVNSSIQTAKVAKQNLVQTVLTTGQVVSTTDLSLGFQGSGTVQKILVSEGDKVKSGQSLASLDQGSALAALTSARGSLALAQANYNKLVAGATAEDIKTTEDARNTAKQNLANAYGDTLTTLQDGYVKIYNAYTSVITLQNTYFYTADQESITVGNQKLKMSDNMAMFKSYLDKARLSQDNLDIYNAIGQGVISMNNVYDSLGTIREIFDQGIYYSKVTSEDKSTLDTQRGYINTGITNLNNAKQTIDSDTLSLQTAEDQLALKKAPPRQSDLDAAKAQITSAQGQVDSAQVNLNNLILKAPEDGTITLVDVKVGELTTATKEVMVLQNIDALHVESNVNEANIAVLLVGQKIEYTLDAFGPDQIFNGSIISVNPASTVISGVVNYKVTGSIENVPGIRPGMTANMTIMTGQKDNVLAVPSTAIINKANGHFVRVLDDLAKAVYHEVQVQTGMEADGGLVEIISGVTEGQDVITYIK